LGNPAVEPPVHIALRAIQIANSLALDKSDLVPGRIDALVEVIASQPEEFKVNWSFKGVKYFIGHNEQLLSYPSLASAIVRCHRRCRSRRHSVGLAGGTGKPSSLPEAIGPKHRIISAINLQPCLL
jgi:hypothetical protein